MKKPLVAFLIIAVVAVIAAPAGAASNDPYFAKQWGLHRIHAEQAWATSTGSNVLVAVVDTGVDLTHPDLAANVVSYTDADFVEPDGTCTGPKGNRTCTQDGAQDKNGHGTHVAGIIAAVANNGVGVAGVAPGAKILPVRVLDASGTGDTNGIAEGVRYAADKGARVINLSLGMDARGAAVKLLGLLDPLYDAIDYAISRGAVVVIAAGNDSMPLCAEPAAHNGVVCVGATDSRDAISWFSNYDSTGLQGNYVVAPGGSTASQFSLGANSPTAFTCAEDILSTYLRTQTTYCGAEPGYEAIAGTSMATPHVSGVAALLSAKGLTNTEIVDCLKSSSDDLGAPGPDPVYGYGLVDALSAVTSC